MPTAESQSVSSPAKLELLAPAGDWDALKAAVANGADAVYFGLSNFNARHRAHNFTEDELADVMDYLHRHNVKGYLTFNTLIFSDELPDAARYIRAIAAAGVDAVLVQDFGLTRLIRAMAPGLPIHGSTQMTLTEPRGIEFVRRLGVERVVLARELSIEEIKKIAAATTMELEVFIHGALCVAYSGQCLTSESLGGRSANRGQCAQACRLPYDLVVDGQVRPMGDINYLVSPHDLAGFDLVDELARLGVKSLKIEGRLKQATYVAATVQAYRGAIDAASAHANYKISPQAQADLEQVFSRGLSHGFLDGVNHQKLVQGRFPKSRGRFMGKIVNILSTGFIVDIPAKVMAVSPLKPGDGVVFDQGRPDTKETGGRIYRIRQERPNRYIIELGAHEVRGHQVKIGALLWKTDDPEMDKRLLATFAKDRVVHRVPVDMHVIARTGSPMRLTLTDGTHDISIGTEERLPKADKFPATDRLLKEQFGMLLMTPFELRNFTCEIAGEPITRKPLIADLKKRAVEMLIERRKRAHEVVNPNALEELHALPHLPSGEGRGEGAAEDTAAVSPTTLTPALSQRERKSETSLYVMARTLEQVEGLCELSEKPHTIYADFEDVRRYKLAVDVCRKHDVKIAVATMRIHKPGEDGWLQHILDCQPDAVLVRNIASIHFFQDKAPGLPLIGDYSLNISNELTARIFDECGLVRSVPSYDLNWKQMSALISRYDASKLECVVHQHMPMFHMEHCVFAHTLSSGKDYRDCGRPCETHLVDLRDRMGKPHPLIPDAGCRNTLYNADAQSAADYIPKMKELGIRHFRVELLRQKKHEVAELVTRYREILAGTAQGWQAVTSLRVLNQLGVTRGTLERE